MSCGCPALGWTKTAISLGAKLKLFGTSEPMSAFIAASAALQSLQSTTRANLSITAIAAARSLADDICFLICARERLRTHDIASTIPQMIVMPIKLAEQDAIVRQAGDVALPTTAAGAAPANPSLRPSLIEVEFLDSKLLHQPAGLRAPTSIEHSGQCVLIDLIVGHHCEIRNIYVQLAHVPLVTEHRSGGKSVIKIRNNFVQKC